jgi:hypothetical protein
MIHGNLKSYVDLARQLAATDPESQAADALRDRLDQLWYSLSDPERQWLNDQDWPEGGT